MITLRNFTDTDAQAYQQKYACSMSLAEIRALFAKWNGKQHADSYFEMFAIVKNGAIVGQISLYQLSKSMISCGPEVFPACRRQGIGAKAMRLAMDTASRMGYKTVLQQIRSDNTASIALHNRLGFETDGYPYKNKKGNDVVIYLKALV